MLLGAPVELEFKPGYASFRPVGKVSFAKAVHMGGDAIKLACRLGAERLLIDISELKGFEPPTTVPRFYLMELLAAVAVPPIKIALVCPPEFIREDRYGVMIARHRGLVCEAFTSESEALEWLLAE